MISVRRVGGRQSVVVVIVATVVAAVVVVSGVRGDVFANSVAANSGRCVQPFSGLAPTYRLHGATAVKRRFIFYARAPERNVIIIRHRHAGPRL